jgi:cob(I)alamin adenosyltransferase
MGGRIYTRGGDAGQTSLGDGTRTPKRSERVEAYGTVDEAASWVGFARAALDDPSLDAVLAFAAQRLLNAASALATPTGSGTPSPSVTGADVTALERAIDRIATGAEMRFVLPGGSEAASRLDVARAVVRRAERRVLALEDAPAEVLRFLNRLSDLLYAAARHVNASAGVEEQPWDAEAPRPR